MKNTGKKMLVIIVLNIVTFTIAAIALQFYTQIELSSTLITCWYGFWTVEIIALAGIKTTKVKNQQEEVNDDESDFE